MTSPVPYASTAQFISVTVSGGAGVHWNGMLGAFPLKTCVRSRIEQRYGKGLQFQDMTIQVYPRDIRGTGAAFRPFRERSARLRDRRQFACHIRAGGNPFEGARATKIPHSAVPAILLWSTIDKATAELGYKSFPLPAAK